MWGEVKFWASRYSKWIWTALGLLLMTLIFVLVSRFSIDDDRQMKKQAREDEKIQEVIEEQEDDLLGDSQFSDTIKNIPTAIEIKGYLDSQEIDEKYESEEAYEIIENEYGKETRILAEFGYLLDEGMTADQRLIIQLLQESTLLERELIGIDEVQTIVTTDNTVLGIPKTAYHVTKYVGKGLTVDKYKLGFYNDLEEEPKPYEIYGHTTADGILTGGYVIDTEVDLGDLTVAGGYVLRGEGEGTNGLISYLLFKPNYTMTGAEYLEHLEELDIKINGSEPSEFNFGDEGLYQSVDNIYSVQMTDMLVNYLEEDGYNAEDNVTLNINGKDLPLTYMGTGFVVEVGK